MKFDKLKHQQIILQLLDSAQVPGNAVKEVYELRMAVETADVPDDKDPAAPVKVTG